MSLEYQNDEQKAPDEMAGAATMPFPLYTAILIACIAIVSIAQLTFGLNESIDAAGFNKPLFRDHHEYWRLLTGAALHGGVLHVALNGYALYMFGKLIEMLSNRAHLAIVFLLAAIGGSLLSLVFMPNGVSVGASGGIVGLLGYMAIYAFRRRDFISPEFRRSLVFNIGFIFLYGVLLYNVIDNFGHLGGLITGGVYGLIQIPSDPYTDPRNAAPVTRILGVAALAIFIATSVLSILLIVSYR
ncbi:MAG: rhomboid family intramembrane serine protease [Acidobacteriota bacterium]